MKLNFLQIRGRLYHTGTLSYKAVLGVSSHQRKCSTYEKVGENGNFKKTFSKPILTIEREMILSEQKFWKKTANCQICVNS